MRYLVGCDQFFPDTPGGAQRVAWDVAQLARDAGHEVAMLVGDATGNRPPRETVEGISVVRYRVPQTSRFNPLRHALRVRAAVGAARAHFGATARWDVVHSHVVATGSAVFAVAGRARRVCTVHSPAALEQAINWADGTALGAVKLRVAMPLLARTERRLYAAADALHTLSRFTRDELGRLYGERVASQCTVIPGWVRRDDALVTKAEARARLGWPAAGRIVYSLRRMVPRMGLDVLVDALHRLADVDGLFAVLAGDGPERAALRARAASGPARDRVVFPGRLSDEDAMLAYRAADVFVVPTRALECFGLILLEAMGHGCPVVASAVGAIPEVLAQIFPAGLTPPGDVSALAATVRGVLAGDLAPPPPEALIAAVEASYGRARIAPAYLEFLFARAAHGGPDARRG